MLSRATTEGASRAAARLIRFDFHFTSEGWRISEANCDVPGGLNEASGLPPLFAPHYPGAESVGDPALAYAHALAHAAGAQGVVAFVHATAYSDDQQMMSFVARRLTAEGPAAHLASPRHVRWRGGRAHLEATWWQGPLDLVVRFFPADWLAGLPHDVGWPAFFVGGRTISSNPATAVVVQTKRFPLVWHELRTPLPTWRALLPETRDPRRTRWAASGEWILKPALGRVGEGVGMREAITARDMRQIARSAWWWPGSWIAQRRFQTLPITIGDSEVYPCLGVYTLDGVVVGAYARLAPRPLIDARAADAAVLAA